ncbi:hypothetical protein ACTJJ0_06240 [Chitinophaga sp. 22321]|uniref:Uncharacterized protein n=1 Tax=Chitinophaga hostae TaxID=2831022 RepID=A0ABS5IYU6_9BACT|nr:hypothetical protein [Chitinophaga hostae]MBS0028141.1 hypothetical protein [Chitinophaga hostae]
MKQIILALLLFPPFLNTSAQSAGKAPEMSLTAAIRSVAPILNKKIPAQVKVVGIGNVAPLAKESTDLNMAIACFLISQQKFRQVVLFENDWILRPVSEYLSDKRAFDSTTIDSLVKISMANSTSRTASFSSFIIWLKKYNLAHPDAPVELSGIAPDNIVQPTYFLATYIFPTDRANGLRLSKKWGNNIHDIESPFKDIADWYQQIKKNTTLFNKYKKLLLRCAEDIDHNDVIRQGILVEATPMLAYNLKAQAMLKWMLKKSDKRTIFYANNEEIAKSGYLINGSLFKPLSLLLHEQLKDKYYTCLTDFADASAFTLIDPNAGPTLATILPSAQTTDLFRKKPTFFMREDSTNIKHYQPRTILPMIGMERKIVPDNNIPPTDALLIVKSLSSVSILKRINDIGDWVK